MKMLRRMLTLLTAALLGLTACDEVTMDVSRPPTFAARAALGDSPRGGEMSRSDRGDGRLLGGASPAGAPRRPVPPYPIS